MCTSIANHGYDVSLVVADGLGDESKNGVNIFDTGSKSGGRLSRMTSAVKRVYEKAKSLNADIYHLHDPELIPIGLKLKRQGKIVIFDAHEDLPKQILGKPYLNLVAKYVLSKFFSFYEYWACRRFDAIVTATPFIRDKFLKINPNTVDINNFPILAELSNTCDWQTKQYEVVYVGDVAEIRGIKEIVKALDKVDGVRLNLAGKFTEEKVEKELKTYKSWNMVNALGFLNRKEVNEILARSKAGLVTLHPMINYIDALPVKMFEYMAAGIPVIASDFPLWREIVEGNNCGICVNPLDATEIGKAVGYLLSHPTKAEEMGGNGRLAVEKMYNWAMEEKKLISMYKDLSR